MSGDHVHGPSTSEVSARRERRLLIALVLNCVIVAGEATAGVLAKSVGLLADAGHNLTDVGGIALALVAVRWARRSPTERRSFGFHRGTVLAAQANAASILVATALITYEAIQRLASPEPVEGVLVIVAASIALAANAASAVLLFERDGDLNMRAALLHMGADAGASVGVVVGGAVIVLTGGFDWVDPAISLVIGGLIAIQAWGLLRSTADVLLESTPTGINAVDVQATMAGVEGVEAVHDLHIWSLSSEVRALSAHVIVDGHPTLEEAQVVGNRVKQAVGTKFRIAHASLDLECEGCVDDGAWCAMESLTPAVPSGHAGHSH